MLSNHSLLSSPGTSRLTVVTVPGPGSLSHQTLSKLLSGSQNLNLYPVCICLCARAQTSEDDLECQSMWRPVVDSTRLPPSLYTLTFETGAFTSPELANSARLAASKILASALSFFPNTRVKCVSPRMASKWVLGIQIQMPLLAHQAFHPPGHLSSPGF